MDPNFQTSFIPKKPLAEERVVSQRPVSLYVFIATIIFFASLASAGGVYFYRASLLKSVDAMKATLDSDRGAFQPDLIKQLQTLDKRINSANELVTNHVAISPIFAVLSKNTLKTVQFTKFSYTSPNATSSVTVNMSGRAQNYNAIALESDQLSTDVRIHDPVFSNISLDQASGNVTFDLTFSVDSDLVRFVSHLADSSSGNITSPMQGSDSSVPAGQTQ